MKEEITYRDQKHFLYQAVNMFISAVKLGILLQFLALLQWLHFVNSEVSAWSPFTSIWPSFVSVFHKRRVMQTVMRQKLLQKLLNKLWTPLIATKQTPRPLPTSEISLYRTPFFKMNWLFWIILFTDWISSGAPLAADWKHYCQLSCDTHSVPSH